MRVQPRADGAIGQGSIDRLDFDAVSTATATGDPAVLTGLDEGTRFLGIAVASLGNTLHARMVIFGGPVIRAPLMLVPWIEAVIRRRALTKPASSVTVVPSRLGRGAVALGAAFVFSQVLVIGSSQVSLATIGFTPSIISPTAPEVTEEVSQRKVFPRP